MSIRSLGDADASCGAKAHGLARLIAAGLPVPEGFVIEADAFREVAAMDDVAPDAIGHALEAAAQRIATAALPTALEHEVQERAAALGRLAVRSSASIEDGALGAAAGVFASLTDVAPGEVWPAIRAVWTSALTPLAVAYARRRAAAIAISVIVQRFAPGARMTVYTRPIGAPRGDDLWLQRDGQLERVTRTAAGERAEASLALAAEIAIDASNGADVELVIDASSLADSPSSTEPAGAGPRDATRGGVNGPALPIHWGRESPLWITQARPIVHPVRRTRQPPPAILLAPLVADGRRWTWDIAHNPDPLSPAQTGLVERIDRTAWSPHALRVCAGYLYTTPRTAPPAAEPPANRAELAARIAAIEPRLAGLLHTADAASAGNAIEAVDRYVAFLQIWLCELSPLIAAARRKLLDRLAERGCPLERIAGLAASMIGPRRGVRDPVMSPAWDVAVPTFAEMPEADACSLERSTSPAPPIDPSACGDLAADVELARAAADAAERDDLWFARAQWRVRSALLARSRELGVGDDIFWIPLDDAITLRSLDPDEVHRRASAARAAHARAADWDMPLVVHDGDARGESLSETHEITLRGVGFGPRTVGRVVRFASLATARSVAHGDVVVTRAITPSLAMLVEKCAALVSETGGLLDHGAALARELGITCVVGCTGAWAQLDDGTVVCVDGDAGVVSPL